MNRSIAINLILLMSLCNIQWTLSRRKVAILEGEALQKRIYESIELSYGDCSLHKTMSYLYLDNVNIDWIDKKSFGNLSNFCSINLVSNNIRSIESDAFSDFPHLKRLDLSINNIRIIQRDLFQHNQQITYLDLSFNRIAVIERNAFENLPVLESLNLKENPLQQLAADMFVSNKKLSDLILSELELSQVNANLFGDLVEVKYLDLSDNKLESLSENLFENNAELLTLYLNGNRIRSVPERIFRKLDGLLTLYLNGNDISELGAECLSPLINMEYLYLSDNKIRIFHPDVFSKNEQLLFLDISNNTIDNLPEGLFRANAFLKIISLQNNQLKEITSENFKGKSNLKELHIAHNNISRIEDEAFSSSWMLGHLDLQFNRLKRLSFNSFRMISNSLEVLLLNNNQIQHLPAEMFKAGMPKLLILNLGHNDLEEFKDYQNEKFPKLTDFYLNNNKLKEVNNILKEGASLQNLYLEFNEIEFEVIEYLLIDSRYIDKDLSNLKFLNISNNKMTRFYPYFLGKPSHAITIDLRNNRVLDVDMGIFPKQIVGRGKLYLWESVIPIGNAQQVETIKYYGHEKILKIEQYQLTVSAVLRDVEEISCEDEPIIVSLVIHQNRLKRIDCLSKVWTLHFLDLSYNELTTLKKEHFAKMIYLETLDISHNQLTSLDLNVFSASVRLTEFYFDECEAVYSWQYYKITEMFPNLTHVSMQNNSIYCPLLSTIIQKFQNSNITIRDYKRDDSIVFDSVHGISCEDYQSLKEILILIMYCMNFLITTVIISVLSIIHHRNNISIE